MLQSVYYDAAQTGLKPPSGLTELYIPLWVYSSSTIGAAGGAGAAGAFFVAKGSTSFITSATDGRIKLHVLNTAWLPTQKFAFEVSIYAFDYGYTANAALWDLTTNTVVSGSTVSTTSITTTVVRSGQFTLIAGHAYGVTIWGSPTSNSYMSKAHLIALI